MPTLLRSLGAKMHFLCVEDILRIHYALVNLFESEGDPITPPGPRDNTLLASAVSRPHTSIGRVEKYPTVESKAAALFHSLVMNHPFHNGNKRTALVCLLVFLDRNRSRIEVSDDELFDFVLSVANNTFKRQAKTGHADEVVDAIHKWIASHTHAASMRPQTMRVQDFLEACERAGASYRETSKRQSWVVLGQSNKSIRISRSTQRLTGQVIKRYFQKLGLSEVDTGVYLDEFQEGINPEQGMIRRFRGVLKRLAQS